MNRQNKHVSTTLAAASQCFHRLVELNATILEINISGHNPVINVQQNDQLKQCYGGGLHLTRRQSGKTIEIYATIIEGCQVEWQTQPQ